MVEAGKDVATRVACHVRVQSWYNAPVLPIESEALLPSDRFA